MRRERHLSVPEIDEKSLKEISTRFQDEKIHEVLETEEQDQVNHSKTQSEKEYLEDYLNARRSSLAAASIANKRINARLVKSNEESYKSGGSLSTLSYLNESYEKSSIDQDETISSHQYAFVPDSDKSSRIIQVSLIMLALLTITFLSIYLVVNKIKPTIVYTNQGIFINSFKIFFFK